VSLRKYFASIPLLWYFLDNVLVLVVRTIVHLLVGYCTVFPLIGDTVISDNYTYEVQTNRSIGNDLSVLRTNCSIGNSSEKTFATFEKLSQRSKNFRSEEIVICDFGFNAPKVGFSITIN
jgi:hypothetical protein